MTVKMMLILLHLKIVIEFSNGCVPLEAKDAASLLTMDEIQSLSTLNEADLKNCLTSIGKEPIEYNISASVWNTVVEMYGAPSEVPEDHLQQLGWIVNGIPPSHFLNMSLTDVETIAVFGKFKNFSKEQLLNLKIALSEQWAGKQNEDLTSYDLETLRQILCVFNSSDIRMIHPDAYKDAAHELSLLSNCPKDVFAELGNLATSDQAFGNPKSWTSVQTSSIGCVLSGLINFIKDIPIEAMEGITADMMDCLSPETFQVEVEVIGYCTDEDVFSVFIAYRMTAAIIFVGYKVTAYNIAPNYASLVESFASGVSVITISSKPYLTRFMVKDKAMTVAQISKLSPSAAGAFLAKSRTDLPQVKRYAMEKASVGGVAGKVQNLASKQLGPSNRLSLVICFTSSLMILTRGFTLK